MKFSMLAIAATVLAAGVEGFSATARSAIRVSLRIDRFHEELYLGEKTNDCSIHSLICQIGMDWLHRIISARDEGSLHLKLDICFLHNLCTHRCVCVLL